MNLISTDQRRGNNKPTLGINRWIISVIYYNSPFIPPHSPVRAFVRSEASSCSFRGEESRLFLRFRRANFINFLTPESRLIPRHALFAHARVGFLGRGRSIPRYDDIIVSTLAYYKRVTIAVLASLSSPAGMPSPRRGFNCPRGRGTGAPREAWARTEGEDVRARRGTSDSPDDRWRRVLPRIMRQDARLCSSVKTTTGAIVILHGLLDPRLRSTRASLLQDLRRT